MNQIVRLLGCYVVALLLLAAAARPAVAVSYSWNVASGDWFTANCIPNGVPGPGDDATVSNAGTCTLDSNTSITNLTLSNGTLTGSGTLPTTPGNQFPWPILLNTSKQNVACIPTDVVGVAVAS